MGGVCHNLTCMPQSPGFVQVLERGQVAADHLLGVCKDSHTHSYSVAMGSTFFEGNCKAIKGKAVKGMSLGKYIAQGHALACIEDGDRTADLWLEGGLL